MILHSNRTARIDATIEFEMGAFNAAMNFAISKRYVPANQRFEGKPKLKATSKNAPFPGGAKLIQSG